MFPMASGSGPQYFAPKPFPMQTGLANQRQGSGVTPRESIRPPSTRGFKCGRDWGCDGHRWPWPQESFATLGRAMGGTCSASE